VSSSMRGSAAVVDHDHAQELGVAGLVHGDLI
jgi:hypothetical protein